MKTSGIVIKGKVIRGDGYGKKIGFPTANLSRSYFLRQKIGVKFGVYAGTAEILGSRNQRAFRFSAARKTLYKAGIVIGPKDSRGLPKIEAHLIGFKGNLYGKNIVLEIKSHLRGFKKFGSEKELKAAIKKDIQRVKNEF